MLLIILGILAIIIGAAAATQSAGPGIVAVIIGVLLIVLGAKRRKAKKARKAAAAAEQAPQPAPAPDPVPAPVKVPDPAFNFRLAGVTFKGRQRILQGIDEGDEKYMGTYHLEPTEYEGAPACRVTLMTYDDDMKEYDIGMVPAALVSDVLAVYDRVTHVSVEVYGGYDGKSYGAAATVRYRVQ